MKKFNFTAAKLPTVEEFKAAVPQKEGKIFRPGDHLVTITSVEDKGPSRDDATWTNLEINFSQGTRNIKTWIDVPTSSIEFTHPEGSTRNPFSQFLQLQAFCRALGADLEPTAESLSEILPGLFEDINVLIGLDLTIQVGYFKNHIARKASGKCFLADRDGKALDDQEFESFNEAAVEAAAMGIEVQKFPKISRFIKKEG